MIIDSIKEHILNQPYIIKCSVCGEDLNVYNKELDNDLELILDIDPCLNCKKEK